MYLGQGGLRFLLAAGESTPYTCSVYFRAPLTEHHTCAAFHSSSLAHLLEVCLVVKSWSRRGCGTCQF